MIAHTRKHDDNTSLGFTVARRATPVQSRQFASSGYQTSDDLPKDINRPMMLRLIYCVSSTTLPGWGDSLGFLIHGVGYCTAADLLGCMLYLLRPACIYQVLE